MTSDFLKFAALLPELLEASPDSVLRDDAAFSRLALELFALQFAHNAPFRRICEARGITPEKAGHWSQIPAVPASAFKELEFSCLAADERTHVFHSSGTSAQRPSRHFHNAQSLAIYEASLWPWFARHVIGRFPLATGHRQLAILTPNPGQAPHSSLVHMFDTVRRRLVAPDSRFFGKLEADGAWTLDFGAALTRLREASEGGRPLVLLGTAFSLVHLLDDLAGRRLRFELPPDSRVMETGGYKGRSRAMPQAELHGLISQRLGVPASQIVCEYGMSELSSQAYDIEVRSPESGVRSPDRVFRFPWWVRAQVVSPDNGGEVAEGETGLLRIFDLANVFSVLAVQTEDLAIRRGDGFELMGRAALVEPRGCSLMAV